MLSFTGQSSHLWWWQEISLCLPYVITSTWILFPMFLPTFFSWHSLRVPTPMMPAMVTLLENWVGILSWFLLESPGITSGTSPLTVGSLELLSQWHLPFCSCIYSMAGLWQSPGNGLLISVTILRSQVDFHGISAQIMSITTITFCFRQNVSLASHYLQDWATCLGLAFHA